MSCYSTSPGQHCIKMNNKVLIIGLVWPEPDATAAGTRMLQLIRFFQGQDYELTFASAAARSPLSYDLSTLSVISVPIKLNDSGFDTMISDLEPGIVVFDRFITEEQFGWRVREICPTAFCILDSEDLHFLRKGREKALGQEQNKLEAFMKNEDAKREIASIYRADLTLVISEFETELLKETFKIDPSLLLYLPFLIDSQSKEETSVLPNFKERKHFITMGNFKHRPNRVAVLFLQKEIWPLIRSALPDTEMNIYGAYITEELQQMNNSKEGFLVKGWAADKKEVYMNSRVCLAPLRFGAGLKGKLIDAMQFGTPCITTRTGAEGMQGDLPWNGFVEDDVKRIAEKAVRLYQDEATWNRSRNNGFALLKHNFDRQSFEKALKDRIDHLRLNLTKHRENNFIGSLLSHHTMQSTKYLSKWIEAKNVNAQ